MDAELHQRALRLYRRPFRYEMGYIWDSDNEMVADDHVTEAIADPMNMVGLALARVRGWGRIGYMESAPALQDAVGELIALALTEYWERHKDELRASATGQEGAG